METISLREYIGDILCESAKDHDIYVLDSDLAKSTSTNRFKEKNPDRFIECGISEQSAMSIAMGISEEGAIPFYVNFAIFVSGTAWTQLRQICYEHSNVKIIGTHPGMDDGTDGASHHANEDIALAKAIPDLKICIPASLSQLKQMIEWSIDYDGPVYIRVARDMIPKKMKEHMPPFEIGKSQILFDDGYDVAIFFEGSASLQAYDGYLEAKKQGYQCKLINISSIKPLDDHLIKRIALESKILISVENHSVIGGLGSSIADVLSSMNMHAPLYRVGVEDIFTESGATSEIKEKYGISQQHIVDIIKEKV